MHANDISWRQADVIIAGGGIAGLTAALNLAPRHVLLLSKTALGSGASSAWAQGGIAAAIGPTDNPGKHAQDTLIAAAGTADGEIVSITTREAPARIGELIALGAKFDRNASGDLALGREAAHSVNRILHIQGDGTGAGLMSTLINAVRNCPSIIIAENYAIEELIINNGRVEGVWARRTEVMSAPPVALKAKAVLMATGGVGGLYEVTTNPPECGGEGLAIAAHAGAQLADLEFVQFHPTAMDVGISPAPLASEALRGEGATLINENGERFMPGVHALAELAPRDVVARAIWRQIGAGHKVYLDCRDTIGGTFRDRFPTIFAFAARAGIDPALQPIPVTPAAHYHMGGIATDKNGRTDLHGLWACGEVAATGLHGANRLASNSLLEGVVFGVRAASDILAAIDHVPALTTYVTRPRFVDYDNAACAPYIQRIQNIMTRCVGVARDVTNLELAIEELDDLEAATGHSYARLSNMLTTARLIARAALLRKESRGGHFRTDYPDTDPEQRHRSFTSLVEVSGEPLKPCAVA